MQRRGNDPAGNQADQKENRRLLEAEDICKEFPVGKEKLHALSHVSLFLDQGECLGIVGESGCGKSTFGRIAAGILEATSGKMLLDGVEITKLRGEEKRLFRRNVQMVFQDPLSSFSPRMKVGTYLMESRRNYDRIGKKEGKEEAGKLLEQVGLPVDFTERYPHELSGGQLQRVAIARAISIHPKLLICDEATGALDVSIQNQIAKLLVSLMEEQNLGCLFIGHDLALVRSVSQRIAVMYLGKIVEVLESETLVKEAAHPYTKALLASVFDVYGAQDREIDVPKGEPPSPLKIHKGCAFSGRCSRCTDLCLEEAPPLLEDHPKHCIACHHPL